VRPCGRDRDPDHDIVTDFLEVLDAALDPVRRSSQASRSLCLKAVAVLRERLLEIVDYDERDQLIAALAACSPTTRTRHFQRPETAVLFAASQARSLASLIKRFTDVEAIACVDLSSPVMLDDARTVARRAFADEHLVLAVAT
jgi:hypothetical protein